MHTAQTHTATVLVRGLGDVASAVAVVLHRAGCHVLLQDTAIPTTSRRGMAFSDAVFDGEAELDGLTACLLRAPDELRTTLMARKALPVTTSGLEDALSALPFDVLVDARMRKRVQPETQRGLVPLTIGLGPNFVAGETVDLAVETSWGDRLGTVVSRGATLPLAGEPRAIGGIGRARFVYAPIAGRFETAAQIGDHAEPGQVLAMIGTTSVRAPLGGTVRGLTRGGIDVEAGTKVLEVDPRGDPAAAFGLGERPRRIADGVLTAISSRLPAMLRMARQC
jgi:xanthine dehydrogenase accessory factor